MNWMTKQRRLKKQRAALKEWKIFIQLSEAALLRKIQAHSD